MSKMRDAAAFKHFKIDNHNITAARCIFEDLDTIIIYYNYNNNKSSITLYYNLIKNRFLYGYNNILTDRQKKILIDKIKKYYVSGDVV